MSNRSLATAQASAKPALQPAANGVLLRQGVTEQTWQPDSQDATGHDGVMWDVRRGFSPAPPPAEERHNGWKSGTDLSSTDVHARTTTIRDDDTGRTLLTWWLIHELAPLLGLDPEKIEIRVNSEAESRVTARGANGVMEGGKIYLHPKRYQPRTREGRRLLAHEATHAAQLHASGEADAVAAEHEAARIASAFAERRVFLRPVQRLLPVAVAADVGAPTEEKPVPLADSVAQTRAREIAAIRKLLAGLWISDGDVFGVLQILETVDFFVARAIIRALTSKERYELADNINPPHFKRYRKQVLACYAALTPGQFKGLDEDLVEAMDLNPLSMSVEEREAAAYTVHHLDNDSLQDLQKSTNRTFVKLLLAWPALEAQDQRELEKRETEVAQAEATEAQRLKKIGEKFAHDTTLGSTLDRVHKLMAGPESFEPKDVQNLSRRCVLVLDTLSGLRHQADTMEYIGRQLDSEGLTEKLVEFLPEASRFDSPEHTETFLALLEARLPEKNIQLAEELLSYGVLDWAVRDNEAEFAYRLIRRLPLAAQDRFRKRDNGKWFMRLEDNIDTKLGERIEYTGIEVGRDASGTLYDAAALYAQKLESGEGTQALGDILNEIEKDGINKKTAETIFAHIAAIGGAKFDEPPPKPGGKEATDTVPPAQEEKPSKYFKPADQVLMDAVVRRLDRLGYVETLLNTLSDRFLFNEDNFASTLKIMLACDPVRVQAHARDLVDRGFLGLGMVTDREAFLAFQMVKALPDAERQAFMEEDDGAVWKTILAEMSADMRQAQGVNLYVGDRAGNDRASILGQLLENATWSAANALKLDGLVHMAIAMGEHKFAFEQSAIGERHAIPELKKVYVKYRLYDPDTRSQYGPDLLKGTKWYQEGIFESIRTLVSGVVFLLKNDLLLFTKTQGANDLNLNDLQDVLGGDIKGVKLADPTAAQPERKEAPEANPNANKVTIHLDVGARVFAAWLPELRIDSVNFHTGGLTFQCGMLTLKNLQISAAFGSEDEKQPSHARLTAGDLTISDLLLAFRESMLAVSRFFIAAPKVAAGTTDTEKASNVPPRAGYHVPVPFLARIAALVWYIFKYKGWWGAQSPMNAAMEGFELLRAAEISFSSLHVDGLTTSGGQSVAGIDVKDFHLRIGLTKPAFLRAQIGSLDQRIRALEADRAAAETIKPLREQRDKADAALKKLEPREAELVALETKYLHDRGNFTDDDRRQIEALQKELKDGAFLDLGSIDVTGISGTVTAEPIHLKGLHGEGESAAMGIGFVMDANFIKNFAGGEAQRLNREAEEIRQPRISEQAGDAKFKLEIAEFHTGKITVSGLPSAKKVINAQDVSVAARGKKGQTEFAVDIEKAQTGDIIGEGNKITVPNAVLPSIKLSRFHFENAQYIVDVPEGQTVELIGTTLNLEIEKNPEPKSGESSLRKIAIRELKVPYTAVRGCTITLLDEDGDDLTITLPNGISGGIENIWIKPSEDVANRFTIIPDQNWAIVGGFSFDRANLVRVGAKLPGLFDASANVGLEGFYMGFLTDGSTTLNLSRAVAKEIQGQIKGSKFSMTTGKSRHGGEAGVVVQGIHKNKDGLSIDQLGAFGFVYENTNLGLTLDIQGAILPGPTGGFSMPKDGPIRIPKLEIGKAFFHINDLMAMDTGGAKGAPSKIDEELLNFLDTLYGDIDLVLHVDADYVRKLTRDFPVVIHIEKGQIDYLKFEKSVFRNSTVLQQAIDFEYDKDTGRLFVQLDLKTLAAGLGLPLGAAGALLGLGAGAAMTRELYGWNLRENDSGINERQLAEQKQVRLKSLMRPFLPDGTPSTDSGKEEPLPINITDIDARINQITLGLKGQAVIDLAHLNKSGLRGRIKLGAPGLDAVTGLTVTGDMKKGFALGLGGVNLSVDGLAIDGDREPSKKRAGVTTKSDVTVSTGQIHIGSLQDTSLTFEKGRRGALKHLQIYPAQLEGTVSSATAENIEVALKKEKRGEKKEGTQ